MNKRTVFIGFLCFLALSAVVISLWAIVRTATTTDDVRDTQLEGTPLGQKIAQSIDDVEAILNLATDCLTPGGRCYELSQQNTQDILDQFRDDAIASAACADQPGVQTEEEIRACVEGSRNDKTPQP